MMRLVMERAGLTMWPILSFVIFLASMIGMVIWLYRPGSAAFYDRLSRQALGNGNGNGNVNGNGDNTQEGRN